MSKQTFRVTVKKDYVHGDNSDDILTYQGIIQVEAESQADAERMVKEWMAGKGCERPLQTIDPRIKWEEGCDPEELDGEGYNYLDWSFEVEPKQHEAFVQFEYDTSYAGGNYCGTGNFVSIPLALCYRHGYPEAFRLHTGLDPLHIVHYSSDDLYDADGNLLD